MAKPDKVYSATVRRHRKDFALSAAVSCKMEDGNIKAALRLLCSDDKPADFSETVLSSMQEKHPSAALNRKSFPAPSSYSPLQVSESIVLQAIRSFPAGSSGGPDGFRPQHLADLIACKTGGLALLSATTGFVNFILSGGCPPDICPVFFGARLIAIEKKSGGFRPIVVGYTIRRLVAKCANQYAQEKLSQYFRPVQLGVSVSGGCEAAVHATSRFLSNLNSGEVVTKLDFITLFIR